jgi:rSAM/selenodomain-associated transferase 2
VLSVVIPALNAGAVLGECLVSVAGADEIVVVDGGSSDDTVAVAAQAGAAIVHAPLGRGVQLHAGATAARGNWLLFLHADTKLGSGWREGVAHHVAAHGQEAACFRFRLDDSAWQARLLERAVALRVRRLRLPYGDQGLLISRALYEAVGGYRALPLMEDVDLVRRLGRGRLRMLKVAAVTSAERWRQGGWLRRSARNLSCLVLYAMGVSPERIARLYA